MYKRFIWHYFVNKNSKQIDKLYIYGWDCHGIHFRWGDKVMSCSFSQAEGKFFEDERDPRLLAQAGKCRQNCYYGKHRGCTGSCSCSEFIDILSAEAQKLISVKQRNYGYRPSPDCFATGGD